MAMSPPGTMKKAEQGMAKGAMPPPGMPKADPEMPDDGGEGGKKSVAEAHKVGAEEHCKECVHYEATSGECAKVEGYWEPEDACVKYFEAGGGEDESAESDDGPSEEMAEGEDSAQ